MAVSRYRARTRLARWWAAAAICLLALVCAGGLPRQVGAIGEAVVDFDIVQSPAAPATVQVGSTVTFDVTATATGSTPLLLDFDYASGLQWESGVSNPAAVVCTDDSPSAGMVRCSYGTIPAAGPIVPLKLTFSLTADATVSDGDFTMRSSPVDGAPDSIDGGEDTFTGGGTLTAFTAAMFTATGSAAASVFEGAQVAFSAALANNSGVSTGAFDPSISFAGGSVSAVSCGSGTASSEATSIARCSGSDIPAAGTLGVTASVRPADTADGTDIQPVLEASALGIAAAGLPLIEVREVGLENTGAATLAVGTPVNVCTAAVTSEVANRATLGNEQPGNIALLAGSFSGNSLLQLADFSVTGPGAGTITAATGCAAGQSGVRFTPSLGGVYTVTARYNIGGTNILTITVPGSASNPVPTVASVSPATAPAGSPDVAITVTGSNFVAGAQVLWDGVALASSAYVSGTSMTATIPAGELAAAGSGIIRVSNPTPGGGASAGSVTFTITPVAAKLAFTTQPGNGVVGSNLATQPVVKVQDAAGTVISTDNMTQVTLAISGGANLTCDGTLTKTVVAGVATFAGCKVTPAGTGYTLSATSSPTLTGATSNAFSVTAAPPAASAQLVVADPTGLVARSRLTFNLATGTLTATDVKFFIIRKGDNKYWNGTTGQWQAEVVGNAGVAAGTAEWKVAVTGEARRQFAGVTVTVKVEASAAAGTYFNPVVPEIAIR